MRRRGHAPIRVVLAALVMFGAAPSAPATPPPAGRLGIQLVDAPTSERHDPRSRLYIVDQLPPGATISRRVRVSNFSPEQSAVAIYAAGASISDGQFRFADDHTGNELTSWTTITAPTVTLQPQQHIDVAVRIAIPRDATGGERYAVIWAEQASAPVVNGAREINRVGVRTYLDVSGAEQRTDFTIDSISAARGPTGTPILTAHVHNIGDRAVDVSGTVELTAGPAGTRAGPVPTEKPVTIAPGDTQAVAADFDPQLAAGPWQAAVSLTSGVIHHAASATVTFSSSGDPAVVVAANAPSHPGWWWLLIAVAAVTATAAGWSIIRRRSRKARPASTP